MTSLPAENSRRMENSSLSFISTVFPLKSAPLPSSVGLSSRTRPEDVDVSKHKRARTHARKVFPIGVSPRAKLLPKPHTLEILLVHRALFSKRTGCSPWSRFELIFS